jgi:hypothetical protein
MSAGLTLVGSSFSEKASSNILMSGNGGSIGVYREFGGPSKGGDTFVFRDVADGCNVWVNYGEVGSAPDVSQAFDETIFREGSRSIFFVETEVSEASR